MDEVRGVDDDNALPRIPAGSVLQGANLSAAGSSLVRDSVAATTARTGFGPLESKLYPPPARDGTVARTSLIARLCASRTEPVVAIIAGPGFGKTTLLSQWADSDERPFAWVSLDDRDNDPAVFLSCLAEALHRIGGATSPLFDALSAPGGASETTILARLGSVVLGMAPSVLVLDDVHLLRNPSCIDAIATLIVHAPEGFQVVVAGRTEPAFLQNRPEGRAAYPFDEPVHGAGPEGPHLPAGHGGAPSSPVSRSSSGSSPGPARSTSTASPARPPRSPVAAGP